MNEQGFFGVLLDILEAHPQGIKEWDLSQELRARRLAPFATADLGDDLELFQLHFTLFHLLYRLQEQLAPEGRGLEIHCLKIQLTPHAPSDSDLPAPADPLKAYYLDLDRLEETNREQVEAMLGDFWKAFGNHLAADEAWAVLGLTPGASEATIKSRFRRLAQEMHPDKGGAAQEFTRLHEAKRALLG